MNVWVDFDWETIMDLEQIKHAQEMIRRADHILIGAGAGMGIDSGLPDFRGDDGFWKAYPPFKGKSFFDIANANRFRSHPRSGWGFYGHRLEMYRNTLPHDGFRILLDIVRQKRSYFVYTSNVDGQFQKAGFDEELIYEIHGSIHHFQCQANCSREIWPDPGIPVTISEEFEWVGDFPLCPKCGGIARPNILMFGDWHWESRRSNEQGRRFSQWKNSVTNESVLAIELGAGTTIPSVRFMCEHFPLIRINPREPEILDATREAIGLAMGALDALTCILRGL